MIDKVRRLVTGETGEGTRAVWTQVHEVEPDVYGGMRSYQVWGWDELPTLPQNDPRPYECSSLFPPAGGLRLQVIVYPPRFRPGGSPGEGYEAVMEARRVLTEAVPHGRVAGAEPGMHRTDTIDFGFVVSGELVSDLEGGGAQTLRPGDVYIQNGGMHAWRNDTDEPTVVWFLMLGASRVEPS